MLGNMTKGMNEVTPMNVATRSTSTTSKNFNTESKEGGSSTKVVVVIGVVLSNKSLKVRNFQPTLDDIISPFD